MNSLDEIENRIQRGHRTAHAVANDRYLTCNITEEGIWLSVGNTLAQPDMGKMHVTRDDPEDEWDDYGSDNPWTGPSCSILLVQKVWKVYCPKCVKDRNSMHLLAANKTDLSWCTHLQAFWKTSASTVILSMLPFGQSTDLIFPYSPLTNAWLIVTTNELENSRSEYPRELRVSWTVRKGGPINKIEMWRGKPMAKTPEINRVTARVGLLNEFVGPDVIGAMITDWASSQVVDQDEQPPFFADKCLKCFRLTSKEGTPEKEAYLAMFGVCTNCSVMNASNYMQARRNGVESRHDYENLAPSMEGH